MAVLLIKKGIISHSAVMTVRELPSQGTAGSRLHILRTSGLIIASPFAFDTVRCITNNE